MSILFDDDLFDAEERIARTGHAFFDKYALAEILGLSSHSLSKLRSRGQIPEPHHYQDEHGGWGTNLGGWSRAIWSTDQVARMLVDRG